MEEMPALGKSCPRSFSPSQTLGLLMMLPLKMKISEHVLPVTVVQQPLSPTSCFPVSGLSYPPFSMLDHLINLDLGSQIPQKLNLSLESKRN